jgi:hypothetical protein
VRQTEAKHMADDIAIRVEETNRRDMAWREIALPARFSQQVFGQEDGRLVLISTKQQRERVRPRLATWQRSHRVRTRC